MTTNVDLSATYLERGRENFRRNGLDPARERFLQEDCIAFLRRGQDRYGVIYLNPPSFSRSHRMDGDFDITRDHVELIRLAARRLDDGGALFFSTHARGFELDAKLEAELLVKDISKASVPEDYRRSPHRSYEIRRR